MDSCMAISLPTSVVILGIIPLKYFGLGSNAIVILKFTIVSVALAIFEFQCHQVPHCSGISVYTEKKWVLRSRN